MRIAFVGTTGSGKSTTGRAAAGRLGILFVELDAIHHGPNWTPTPDALFRSKVAEVVAQDAWVIDGNYAAVRDLVRDRATDVIWLDLPRWLIMWQVGGRSLRRVVRRETLWNGNRESIRQWVRPEHPIRWAWSTYHDRRRRYEAEIDQGWKRLRNRKEIKTWLDALPASEPGR